MTTIATTTTFGRRIELEGKFHGVQQLGPIEIVQPSLKIGMIRFFHATFSQLPACANKIVHGSRSPGMPAVYVFASLFSYFVLLLLSRVFCCLRYGMRDTGM